MNNFLRRFSKNFITPEIRTNINKYALKDVKPIKMPHKQKIAKHATISSDGKLIYRPFNN